MLSSSSCKKGEREMRAREREMPEIWHDHDQLLCVACRAKVTPANDNIASVVVALQLQLLPASAPSTVTAAPRPSS